MTCLFTLVKFGVLVKLAYVENFWTENFSTVQTGHGVMVGSYNTDNYLFLKASRVIRVLLVK